MDRVLTKKGAVVELAIVTVGVLIALSFDGLRGVVHDRSLVAEARENLTRELRDNKRAVEGLLEALPARTKELDRLRQIADLLREGKPVEGEAGLQFAIPTLITASRSTAEITGAFGLMDYSEATTFAQVYGMQEKFERLTDDWLTKLQPVMSRVSLIDTPQPPATEVEIWAHDIRALQTHLFFVGEYARQLAESYDRVLAAGQ